MNNKADGKMHRAMLVVFGAVIGSALGTIYVVSTLEEWRWDWNFITNPITTLIFSYIVIPAAVIGAGIGFFWRNLYPKQKK